jgi:hypothetical protein
MFDIGRGGGKDDAIKTVVNYECVDGGHEIGASPGQRMPVLVLCPLRNQSVGMLRMVQGEAQLSKMRPFVANITRDSVEYVNGLVACVQTADEIGVVGDTVPLAIRNEWALFPDARAIDANLRPALRRIIGTPPHRLIAITSSYIRDGLAWETFRDNFGRADTDVLVVQGSTELFNPNIDRSWLATERRRLGELLYLMHFHCEWQDAIFEQWLPGVAITSSVQAGCYELPYKPSPESYITIACDAAFSREGDRFGWSVASTKLGAFDPALGERGRLTTTVHACGAWRVDRDPRGMAIRLRDEVCVRFHTRQIIIDQYSAHAFAQICRDVGLQPFIVAWTAGERADDAHLSKLQRYKNFRTALSDGSLRLPDVTELVADLRALRGTLLPAGGERVEVPRTSRGHGDTLSAVVMSTSVAAQNAVWIASRRVRRAAINLPSYATGDEPLTIADASTEQGGTKLFERLNENYGEVLGLSSKGR